MNLLRHPWKVTLFACFILLVGGFVLAMLLFPGSSSGARGTLFREILQILTGQDRRRESAALKAQLIFQASQKARAAQDAPWPMFGGTPERNMANVTDKHIATNWSIE